MDNYARISIFLINYRKIIFAGIGDGAIANGVIDPLVSGLACYATMQLKVLKDNLQHLREHAEEEFYATCQNNIDLSGQEEVINKIIYNRIVKCIDHHVAIFK
jgi:catabolite regulation protein CreA